MVQTGGTLNAVPKTLPKQQMLQLHLWFLLRTSLLLDPNSRETVRMPRMLPHLRLGKNMSRCNDKKSEPCHHPKGKQLASCREKNVKMMKKVDNVQLL